jgi:hypothetical protein
MFVVVLEEAKVSALTSEFMREVWELSNLKEFILFYLALNQSFVENLTGTEENSSLLGLSQLLDELLRMEWVLILHLVPHSIPQSNLFSMHIWKNHVYSLNEFVKWQLVKIPSRNSAYFLQQGLLCLPL